MQFFENNIYANCVVFVLLSCIFFQCFYFVFFFLRILTHKKNNVELLTPNNEKPINVSVIIPFVIYNEERIVQFLHILKNYKDAQEYHFEVVLVYNCTHKSLEQSFEKLYQIHNQIKIIPLHHESKEIIGEKYALSIGIKSASFDQIILTKENCLPTSSAWLSSMINNIDNKTDLIIGYSNYQKDTTFFNKFIRFERVLYTMQAFAFTLSKIPMLGSGTNMYINRKKFYEKKGFTNFNNFVGGEDNLVVGLIAQKNNVKINVDSNSFLTINTTNFSEWIFFKKFYISTIKYFKYKHQFFLFLYATSLIFFYISFIVVFFLPNILLVILYSILFRFLLAYIISAFLLNKFQQKDLIIYLPILEICMIGYYLRYGLVYFKSPKKRF